MPPRLVSDSDLFDRLTDAFRAAGYDGASLTELAAATGLQKASLYHRFPGGKAQMATEVVERLGTSALDVALAPIAGPTPTRADIEAVGAMLTAFYEAGTKSCLLETMSVQPVDDVSAALRSAMTRWVAAFAHVARSAGATRAAATVRAQDAIASIEGALVLARVTGDTHSFTRAITRLPEALLGAAHSTGG